MARVVVRLQNGFFRAWHRLRLRPEGGTGMPRVNEAPEQGRSRAGAGGQAWRGTRRRGRRK